MNIAKRDCIRGNISKFFFFMLLFSLLVINYMYNFFNPANTAFVNFQSNSDALVFNMILADQHHADTGKWGLGFYIDSAGWITSDPSDARSNSGELFTTNDLYDNGYAKTGDGIIVNYNPYTSVYFKEGSWLKFEDGTTLQIESSESDVGDGSTWTIAIKLQNASGLCEEVNGSLLNVCVSSSPEGNEFLNAAMDSYDSSYGLQGRIVRRLAFLNHNKIIFSCLRWLCAIAAATVFALIIYQIYIKYDVLMASVFYIVFLLSPWIVNFAKSVYWLEFLWFIPMLIGLVFSNYRNHSFIRYSCYFFSFLTIFIKALCGYEYITTIMLGLISFLLVDLFVDFELKADKKKILINSGQIIILGTFALSGFLCAFLVHANLRGGGSLIEGIKSIYVEDILRSTLYAWTEDYDESYQGSMSASLLQVFFSYFHRPEEIVSGINGHLFPLLSVGPLIIFLYNKFQNKLERRDCFLYGITFLTSVSWFILGKSHSAMHGFLNFVLWNFGYIQVCFYIILKQFISWIQKPEKTKIE